MAKARIGAGFLEVGLLQLLKLTGQRQSVKTSQFRQEFSRVVAAHDALLQKLCCGFQFRPGPPPTCTMCHDSVFSRLASVFILFHTKLLCQFQKIPQDDTVNFTYFLPKNKRAT